MVVGGEPGLGERSACSWFSMPSVQQASMPSPRTTADHVEHALERGAVRARRATPRPCRTASRPAPAPRSPPRSASARSTRSVRVDAGLVVRRLRAVGAVFRAAAGLDAQQHAPLHLVGAMMRAVHGLRAEHQIGQRRARRSIRFRRRSSRGGERSVTSQSCVSPSLARAIEGGRGERRQHPPPPPAS